MKLGGETVKQIVEKIFRENSLTGAANKTPIKLVGCLMRDGKEIPLDKERECQLMLEAKDAEIENLRDELETFKKYNVSADEQIDNLKKEKKIAEEQIIFLENDAKKCSELEKKITSEVATSSKQKSKTKSHDQCRKSKKKEIIYTRNKKGEDHLNSS